MILDCLINNDHDTFALHAVSCTVLAPTLDQLTTPDVAGSGDYESAMRNVMSLTFSVALFIP